MKVWVVMGNDFPHSVFAREVAAEAFVKLREEEDKVRAERERCTRIYWRVYEFPVIGTAEAKP